MLSGTPFEDWDDLGGKFFMPAKEYDYDPTPCYSTPKPKPVITEPTEEQIKSSVYYKELESILEKSNKKITLLQDVLEDQIAINRYNNSLIEAAKNSLSVYNDNKHVTDRFIREL